MNRMQLLDMKAHLTPQTSQALQRTHWRDAEPCGVCHASFVPLHYEANYAYPLLVWLHGEGESERQLRSVVPRISMRNYVAIAPRGTQRVPDHDSSYMSYTWQQTDDDILLSEHRVVECVELARDRSHVASERIFLLGYGSGGTMALRIGMLYPSLFAGIASIGGPFPIGLTPLTRIKQARHLQILLVQSRESTMYSEATVCDNLRLLHAAGMSLTLRQYPRGDELSDQMLGDIDEWIMAQVIGSNQTSDETSDYRPNRLN